jgi:hypothetical protein
LDVAVSSPQQVEQIDFHSGTGPNKDAPSFVFGLGDSYRFDRLF